MNRVVNFVQTALIILLLYQLGNSFPWSIDFTEDQRFSLQSSTKKMLNQLDGTITMQVYLDGDLPPNFLRLRNSIEQTMSQFSRQTTANLSYNFIDPSIALSAKARNQYYRSLIEKGLQPSSVTYTKKGEKTEKVLFPGAVIYTDYGEFAVNFIQGNRTLSIDQILNLSIENIEYQLISALKSATNPQKKKVGLITGHGGLDSTLFAGFTNAVLGKYDLFRIDLSARQRLTGYDAVVLAKPTEAFTESEKYVLDQYVMHGGSLLVFIDALAVNMQDAAGAGTVALPYETNLDDLFFRYGVRINKDYVADINCSDIPIVAGEVSGSAQIELLPWPYFPVVSSYSDHPTVKNLDASWFRGASTLDTVKADGVRKTPLLFTSEYTKVFSPPVIVSYNDLKDKLLPENFTSGRHVLGYLLEGNFASLYKNRFSPIRVDQNERRTESIGAKIIILSDGDFVRNEFNPENQKPLPMGQDPYGKTLYANEIFVLNSLEYLTDDLGLMSLRNKTIKLRPLDKAKVTSQATYYQYLNLFLPALLVVIFGIVKHIYRKNSYER